MQKNFDDISNDAPKEPQWLLRSIIRRLLEEKLGFCINNVNKLLMQNYFEEPSNDAPKESLRLLWSIIQWLLKELYHFCNNKG